MHDACNVCIERNQKKKEKKHALTLFDAWHADDVGDPDQHGKAQMHPVFPHRLIVGLLGTHERTRMSSRILPRNCKKCIDAHIKFQVISALALIFICSCCIASNVMNLLRLG